MKIALAGEPNVGKSCFFNHLTGIHAIVSNYPGTTVELMKGKARFNDSVIEIVDLPGTYALGDASEDERVAKNYLIKEKPDVVIDIIDCTALERNLYLTLQLLELKIPFVVALNFYEEAKEKGISIDKNKLEKMLGVPVIIINALSGKGIYTSLQKAVKLRKRKYLEIKYDDDVEKAIEKIEKLLKEVPTSKRHATIRVLENDSDFLPYIKDKNKLETIKKGVEFHPDLAMEVSKERHGKASIIARECSEIKRGKIKLTPSEQIDEIITNPSYGLFIVIFTFLLMFGILFYFGGFFQDKVSDVFETKILPYLSSYLEPFNPILQEVIVNAVIGTEAGLAVAVPYVGLFYIFLSVLEDTGFLPRVTFLIDKYMHKIGLHGKAIIPMMLGIGCSVPAITSTRMLNTRRERLITAILLSGFIPCSSRIAIIFGIAGHYLGWWSIFLIYLIMLSLAVVFGKILNKILPGEATDLIMELPNYRRPLIKNVLMKTWLRMKDYVYIVIPFLIVGGAMFGLMNALNLVNIVVDPFKPIISGWLLLPKETVIPFIYGLLQKDLTIAMITTLGGTDLSLYMTSIQIFTFSLVAVTYIPCMIAVGMLIREFGWKEAVIVSISSIFIAIFLGGIVARVLMILS